MTEALDLKAKPGNDADMSRAPFSNQSNLRQWHFPSKWQRQSRSTFGIRIFSFASNPEALVQLVVVYLSCRMPIWLELWWLTDCFH